MNLTLVHKLHDYVEVSYRGQPLFRYVYEPATAPGEAPKPYFHPVHTLVGNVVTLARPHDHLWHTGIAMTSAHLSGQNFWGGPTYVRDSGYVWREDQGRIQHEAWVDMWPAATAGPDASAPDQQARSAMRAEDDCIHLAESLAWITRAGEMWIAEERRIVVDDVDPAHACWSLDLAFRLANVRQEALVFGSPTTQGRPAAGYGGLFWRGPRSFQHGTILAADGLSGPEVMGRAAPWLAFIGAHDGTGDTSTILFMDHPSNPRFPTKWFVRNDPYACVSCSFMFDEEYILPAGEALALRYRIVLGHGAWSRARIEDYVARTRG